MMLLPDGRILLSGGATVQDKTGPKYHKDLRQLDTETMLWSKAKTTGKLIWKPRYHVQCQISSRIDCATFTRCVVAKTCSPIHKIATIIPVVFSSRKTGFKTSGRCNHTLTPDEGGHNALLLGGWGLGGLQRQEINKRSGAVTAAAYQMPACDAVSVSVPSWKGRGTPEHK